MLRDHIEFYANGNSRPPEGMPLFLTPEDEPYLRAIAESRHFAFKELKRISPRRFTQIKEALRNSRDYLWDGILRRASAQMEEEREYLR